MSGRQSAARRKKRSTRQAMQRAGVAAVSRTFLPPATVTVGSLVSAVEVTLEGLESQGADLLGRIVITIGGDHPEYPGRTTIEAKAGSLTPRAGEDQDGAES